MQREYSVRAFWHFRVDEASGLLQVQPETRHPLDPHPQNDAGITRVHAYICHHQPRRWYLHTGRKLLINAIVLLRTNCCL